MENAKLGSLNPTQLKFYDFFERRTTWPSKLFVSVSLLLVVAVALMAIVASFPEFTAEDGKTTRSVYDALFYLDVVAASWWSVELAGRYYASPEKRTFFRDPLNIIDLVSVISPFFRINEADASGIGGLVILIRLLRIVRLLRYSPLLRVTALTLWHGSYAISLFLVFTGLNSLFYATLMFWAERGSYDPQTRTWRRFDGQVSPFSSIPEGFYWTIATLCTVGFGDVVPITPVGKFIASFAMLTSILSVALPTSILGLNFSNQWNQYQQRIRNKKLLRLRGNSKTNPKKRNSTPHHEHNAWKVNSWGSKDNLERRDFPAIIAGFNSDNEYATTPSAVSKSEFSEDEDQNTSHYVTDISGKVYFQSNISDTVNTPHAQLETPESPTLWLRGGESNLKQQNEALFRLLSDIQHRIDIINPPEHYYNYLEAVEQLEITKSRVEDLERENKKLKSDLSKFVNSK